MSTFLEGRATVRFALDVHVVETYALRISFEEYLPEACARARRRAQKCQLFHLKTLENPNVP